MRSREQDAAFRNRALLRRACLAIFRATQRLLPPWMRARCGDEMRGMFRRRCDEAAGRGASDLLRLTVAEVGSLLAVAGRARFELDGGERGEVPLALALVAPEPERQPLKVAWICALVAHFALFAIVIPGNGTTLIPAPTEIERPVVLTPLPRPPAPLAEPRPEPPIRRARPVPRPVPPAATPDPPPLVTEGPPAILPPVTEIPAVPARPGEGVEPEPPELRDGPLRAGVTVERPRRIHYVEPDYPPAAARARVEGVVVLEATIDERGDVVGVHVLRDAGMGLGGAAVEAVRRWKFRPTWYRGKPVAVVLSVTVAFTLR